MNAADFQLQNEPTAASPGAFDLLGWWSSLSSLEQVIVIALPVVGYLWWSSSKRKKGKYDSSGDGEYLETVQHLV